MNEAAEFWNQKYKEDSFFFGTKPNAWVQTVLDRIGQPNARCLIELACGEGRNSNHAATLGYTVTATDVSERGLDKTRQLALQNNIELKTRIYDVLNDKIDETFDIVVVTFLHFPKSQREILYLKLNDFLKPGGHLIAEWYHPNQRNHDYTSGGPPSPEMMLTMTELESQFNNSNWQIQELSYTLSVLDEGPGHSGQAALSRLHAIKQI